jgi:CheY-like chemotaxis protein
MADPTRILVVDDEVGILEVIGILLEDEGYQVRTAADGVAALDVLQSWQPDLIVLDLMMQRMDGPRFVAEQRRRTGTNPPLVLLSAHRDLDAEGAGLGALAVVRKPFDLEACSRSWNAPWPSFGPTTARRRCEGRT